MSLLPNRLLPFAPRNGNSLGEKMRRRHESATVDGLHEHRLQVGPAIASVQVQYMTYEPV
jgi:hypothetical protein